MPTIKYPIGSFLFDEKSADANMKKWINDIDTFPIRLIEAIINLSGRQLNTPYRKDGWTVRQLIHHIADSHMNAIIRTKLLLTEDEPTIKPFNQNTWADLNDNDMSIEPSLQIIKGIHKRWAYMLSKAEPDDWERCLIHPEEGSINLKKLTALYPWHGNHHLAHITTLKKRKTW